jgi:hypothetical protein
LAGIAQSVVVRSLVALIVTIALATMPAAQAVAAPAHHAEVAAMNHCDDQQTQGDPRERPGQGCCVPGCAAAAVLPEPAIEPAIKSGLLERPAPDRIRLGHLGEIATPPPRAA